MSSESPCSVITIDGPAGSGKSTVARLVAERLGCGVLDTGAIYRALTWLALERGISPSNASALVALIDAGFALEQCDHRFRLGGRDITREIRTDEVNRHVSEVSAHPEVRRKLVPIQRAQAVGRCLVAEGRDMGTVVFPDALHQFFLDADLSTRAQRRAAEGAYGPDFDLDAVERDLRERDRRDSSREVSPLRVSERATKIDTTGLSIEGVVARVLEVIGERSSG